MADARTGRRSVVQMKATGIEKRYSPRRCYMYVLEPTWSDGVKYKVYRSYGDIIAMSKKLAEAFPIEAGQIKKKERVLPILKETKEVFRSKEVLKTAKKRLTEVSTYFKTLGNLEEKVRVFPGLCSFFEPKADDINVPETARVRPRPKKHNPFLKSSHQEQFKAESKAEMAITAPVPTLTYRAAATYKASGKEEISFNEGDLLEVVEKQNVGWWFVRFEGLEGWAPATYLDPVDETVADEDLCLAGELYISLKAHNACYEDELSFPAGALIEVLNKVLDGWWIGSYMGKAGYVPATYLRPNTTGELCRLPSRHGSAQIPRRRTILRSAVDQATPAERDLAPYRRLTTKRHERATRRHRKEGRKMEELNNSSDDELYVNTSVLYNQSSGESEEKPSAAVIKPLPKPRARAPQAELAPSERAPSGAENSVPSEATRESESSMIVPDTLSNRINRAPGTPPITPRKLATRTLVSAAQPLCS